MVFEFSLATILVSITTFITVVVITINIVFLRGLSIATIRKTIINDILRSGSIIGCTLILIDYVVTITRLLDEQVKEIQCWMLPICALLIIYFSNFEQSVCLVARFIMLRYPERIRKWSSKKILLVSILTGICICAPGFISFINIDGFLLYQYCRLEKAQNTLPRLSTQNAVGIYLPLFLLLVLSLIVLKLENAAAKKILPKPGQRTVNILTAKAQVFTAVFLILTMVLPPLLAEISIHYFNIKDSVLVIPVLFFVCCIFRYLIPATMYIVFNQSIKKCLNDRLKLFWNRLIG